jgi:hypothetical protein
MESTSRAPIFSGYSEALKGIVTIRAFAAETRLMRVLFQDLDSTMSYFWFWWMSNRHLLCRFDVLGGEQTHSLR